MTTRDRLAGGGGRCATSFVKIGWNINLHHQDNVYQQCTFLYVYCGGKQARNNIIRRRGQYNDLYGPVPGFRILTLLEKLKNENLTSHAALDNRSSFSLLPAMNEPWRSHRYV
jgi:hypothetical protein